MLLAFENNTDFYNNFSHFPGGGREGSPRPPGYATYSIRVNVAKIVHSSIVISCNAASTLLSVSSSCGMY